MAIATLAPATVVISYLTVPLWPVSVYLQGIVRNPSTATERRVPELRRLYEWLLLGASLDAPTDAR